MSAHHWSATITCTFSITTRVLQLAMCHCLDLLRLHWRRILCIAGIAYVDIASVDDDIVIL